MFKKLFLLLAIFNVHLFATEWIDEVSIYVYNDVDFFEYTFNTLAMMFASDGFKDLSILSLMFFTVLKAYGWYKTQSVEVAAKDITAFVALAMFALNSNMGITVKIFDKRADHGMVQYLDIHNNPLPTFSAVANVPWVIGFMAGATSYVRYGLTEVYETAGSAIAPDASFAKVGFLGNFQVMKKIIENADLSQDSDLQEFRNKIVAYAKECVLDNESSLNKGAVNLLTNTPSGNTLDAIAPANIGIKSSMNMTYGGVSYACSNFYQNQIEANATTIAEKLYGLIKNKVKPINLDAIESSLETTFSVDTASSVVNSTNPLVSYVANAAIIEPLNKAKSYDQVGLTSPTSTINTSAVAMAKRALQAGTNGMTMWMSEILPYALSFITAIVYALGIFPLLLWAITSNINVLVTYGKSLVSLELVYFGMSIVHNATSFYAQNKAADTLATLFANHNAGNETTLLPQLEHLATMTGVAGTIGFFVALGIPALVMRGEVAGMLGAINSLAGRFNNDARSVREAQQQQVEVARLNEAQQYLRSMGIDAPPIGVGEIEYANRIKQGINNVAQAQGAMLIANNSGMQHDYAQGANVQEMNRLGSTVGVGESGTTMQQGFDSGRTQGHSSGVTMGQQSMFADDDDYYKGVKRQTRSSLEKTRGIGMGDEPTQKDWNDLAKSSSGQFQEGFANARGYNKGAMNGNNLNDDYAQGVESQSAKKAATTAGYGKRIDTGQALKSGGRAGAAMAGVDEGNLLYSKDEHEKIARTNTRSKLESTLKGIEGAGSEDQFVQDQGTKSQAASQSLRRDIVAAGSADKYISRAGTMAEAKSTQMNKDIEAMEEYNIADSSGHITDSGKTALGIGSYEKYGAMNAKTKSFGNFDRKHFKDRAVAGYMEKHPGISKEEAEKQVEENMNKTGLVEGASSEQIAGAIAGMGATNFASSKSLNFMGMNLNMGLGIDGSSRISGQVGENLLNDQTTTTKKGHSTQINEGTTYNSGAQWANAVTALKARGNANPSEQEIKDYLKGEQRLTDVNSNFLSKVGNNLKDFFKDDLGLDMTEEQALMAAGGTAFLTALETKGGLQNYLQGKYFDKESGKLVQPTKAQLAENPKRYRKAGGAVTELGRKLFGSYANDFDGLTGGPSSSQASDGSPNSSSNARHSPNNGQTDYGSNNRREHVNPPSNDIHNSSTNTTETASGGRPAHSPMNFTAEPADIAHTKLSPQGKFHMGGIKGLAFQVGALLGISAIDSEAGEIVGNAMNVVDPTSYIMGQSLGDGSFGGDERKQMNYKLAQSLRAKGDAESLKEALEIEKNGYNLPSTVYSSPNLTRNQQILHGIPQSKLDEETKDMALTSNTSETKEIVAKSSDQMDKLEASLKDQDKKLEEMKNRKVRAYIGSK